MAISCCSGKGIWESLFNTLGLSFLIAKKEDDCLRIRGHVCNVYTNTYSGRRDIETYTGSSQIVC